MFGGGCPAVARMKVAKRETLFCRMAPLLRSSARTAPEAPERPPETSPVRMEHGTEDSDVHGEQEVRVPANEMERIVQMFQQTIQEQQEIFSSIIGRTMVRNEPARIGRGDPWLDQLDRFGVERFEGGNDPILCSNWIKRMKRALTAVKPPEGDWVRLATNFLRGTAEDWWEKTMDLEFGERELIEIKWAEFVEVFNKQYFPEGVRLALELEFGRLQQGDRSVDDYAAEFYRLEEFGSKWNSEASRANRFVEGLRPKLKSVMLYGGCSELREVVLRAVRIEQDLRIMPQENQRTREYPNPVAGARPNHSMGPSYADKRRKTQSGPFKSNVTNNSSMGSASQPVPPRRCFNCNRTGHFAHQCMQGKPSCFNCGEAGHLQRNCTKPQKDAGDKPTASTRSRVFSLTTMEEGSAPEDVIEGEQPEH